MNNKFGGDTGVDADFGVVKKEFVVSIPEVHYQDVIVEASDECEAITKAKEGEGTAVDNSLEYSHTSEDENYHVKEI